MKVLRTERCENGLWKSGEDCGTMFGCHLCFNFRRTFLLLKTSFIVLLTATTPFSSPIIPPVQSLLTTASLEIFSGLVLEVDMS